LAVQTVYYRQLLQRRRSEVPLTLKSSPRGTCRMMRIPRLWTRRGIAVASLWHHCGRDCLGRQEQW
jgi:hypothetical protein